MSNYLYLMPYQTTAEYEFCTETILHCFKKSGMLTIPIKSRYWDISSILQGLVSVLAEHVPCSFMFSKSSFSNSTILIANKGPSHFKPVKEFVYFQTKLLMSRSKVVLEKLIVIQLVKKFLAFYRTQWFSTCLQLPCTKTIMKLHDEVQ